MTLLRKGLLENPLLEWKNNIFYEITFQRNNSFEDTYLKLRVKENRVHSDDVVKTLPDLNPAHPNKKEWEMRKSTLQKLFRYLSASGAYNILELGCGNGWLSYNLATSLDAQICAVDVNEAELLQGARVFSGQENLCFIYANIFGPVFRAKKFEAIILGSSVQYFNNLANLFATLFELLEPSGTIYIVDSPFYKSRSDADSAKKRSRKYFESMGFPEMSDQYFHHTFEELTRFNCKTLYNPRNLSSLVKRKIFHIPLSVFPIISVKK